MSKEKEQGIEDFTNALFGDKKDKVKSKITSRIELKLDTITNEGLFVKIDGDNKKEKIDDLEGVIVGFLHKWQSNFDAVKAGENLVSNYYVRGKEVPIIIKEKSESGFKEYTTFNNEGEIFELLKDKDGNDEKLTNLNRINILFVYIPKLDETVKIYIRYLDVLNSGIINILDEGGKDVYKKTLSIKSKIVQNQRKSDILVFDFELGKSHKVKNDILVSNMKDVFSFIKEDISK